MSQQMHGDGSLKRLPAGQTVWIRRLAARMPFYRYMGIRLTRLGWGRSEIRITPLPDWLFIVGIFLMLLGIFVREWAVTTLRGYFSFRVSVREDHKVIERGPYRLVRHPAYSGSILTIVGIGLAVQSAAAVPLLLVFCGIAYGYRIRGGRDRLIEGTWRGILQVHEQDKKVDPIYLLGRMSGQNSFRFSLRVQTILVAGGLIIVLFMQYLAL